MTGFGLIIFVLFTILFLPQIQVSSHFQIHFVFSFSIVICSLHCAGIQCLMYMYHYPDIWYDYATWHAKSGSVDSAVKVFQRALKALPGNLLLVLLSFP